MWSQEIELQFNMFAFDNLLKILLRYQYDTHRKREKKFI